MQVLFKFGCWILIILLIFSIILKQGKDRNSNSNHFKIKTCIEALNSNSKTIFYVGSSRVMLGVNTFLLNDSLKYWNSINIGISGSSLAQNLYLADYFRKMPGNKIVFVELSRFHKKYPLSFNSATKAIGLANFPNSYFDFVEQKTDIFFKINNLENEFLDWVNFNQNELKQLLSTDDISKNQTIGFVPHNVNSYHKLESFITKENLVFNFNKLYDSISIDKLYSLLKNQKRGEFKVIFFLPVTTLDKSELKYSVPLYHLIPKDSKWEYDSSFLRSVSRSEHLMDKNHLNLRGSIIYSQGLVKYIKAHEDSWK